MSKYSDGLEVLGCNCAPSTDDVLGAASNRAVLIQIKNLPAVVKAQGGALGSLAQSLVPDTIEAKVYDTVASQLVSKFKEQGVDADVKVVTPTGYQPAGGSPIWMPLALGLGGFGVLATAMHFLRRPR